MGKKKVKEPDAQPKDEFDPVELITKRPQTVVLVLQSQEESVLQTVCEALYKFAEKTVENKLQLVNIGALEHLTKLISHEDKIIKRNAVMCLGSVASEESARRVMRKFGCIPPLLAMLAPEEELVCHEFATLALSYLAVDYTSKVEIFEKHGLPMLIQHLMSPDCDAQHNAARAIGLLLEDFRVRATFRELNGVEPLLKLLDSEYPAIQDLALNALIASVQDADNRSAMRELEGLSKLVNIIGTETMTDLHMSCLKCLAGCLEDTESLQLIQSTGVFHKLLAFIAESSTPEVQQYAASVITACCKIDENRRIFNEQETEKTLITLLSSDNISTAISAASSLAAMAENLSSQEKIGKLDGIPLIIQLLKNDLPEAKEVSSLALANLTKGNIQNCNVVMEKNTVDIMIKLLSDENSSEIQCNSATCLSNLAQNEMWRTEIVKHGVIKGLSNAVTCSDPKVQICVCQALASFLCDTESRIQLLAEEGFTPIIELLKSNNELVRRNASWVVVLCAVDPQIAQEITKCGGLDVLQEINLSSRRSQFTQTAIERLLDNNLSAKYSVTGALSVDNIIESMFFDAGKMNPGKPFLTLKELAAQKVEQNRPVILVNFKKSSKKSKNPTVNNPKVSPVSAESNSEKSRSKSKEGKASKMKSPRDHDVYDSKFQSSNGEQHIPAIRLAPQSSADVDFLDYIKEVKADMSSVMSSELQIRSLACFVCDKMGGVVNRNDITRFSYELHISELKTELDSNVIPIGKIKQGIYYHRALLFKVLADVLHIPCSLVRGDYGRAWNQVQLCDINENGEAVLPPKTFIVDLMHEPGNLLPASSPEAVSYQRI